METYRKVFFWIFLIVGIYLAILNRQVIDVILFKITDLVVTSIESIIVKFDYYAHGDFLLIPIVIIVGLIFWGLFLIYVLSAVFVNLIFKLLSNTYILYVIVGILLVYPFYVVFINLFELILLLLIQHPSKSEIRRVIGRRKISNETIGLISEKMMAFSGIIPHEIESQIMTVQLKGLSKMIHAEASFIRDLRERRIRQALSRTE
jgi:hypothetical protein